MDHNFQELKMAEFKVIVDDTSLNQFPCLGDKLHHFFKYICIDLQDKNIKKTALKLIEVDWLYSCNGGW